MKKINIFLVLIITFFVFFNSYNVFADDTKAKRIRTETDNFDVNLSSADNDAQTTFETIDEPVNWTVSNTIYSNNLQLSNYITAASANKYVQMSVDDTDDHFHLSREDANILGFKVDMDLLLDSDTTQLKIGADQDFILKHDGSNANIENKTGNWNATSFGQFNFSSLNSYMNFSSAQTQHLYFNCGNSFLFRDRDNSSQINFEIHTAVNPYVRQYGYITASTAQKYIQWTVNDTDDYFTLTRQDANILGFKVDMPLLLTDKILFTQTDGNEYIDSLADGYMDYSATTAHRFNAPIYQPGTFAEIYVSDGSTAQTIATGATYVKLTGFTTNGSSNNCTADAANDKITITKTGYYLVNCAISASSDTVATFKYAAFLNGSEQSQCHTERKYANTNDLGASSFSGIIDVTTASWDLDLRARHDNGGNVDLTPTYINLTVTYLGET